MSIDSKLKSLIKNPIVQRVATTVLTSAVVSLAYSAAKSGTKTVPVPAVIVTSNHYAPDPAAEAAAHPLTGKDPRKRGKKGPVTSYNDASQNIKEQN
jgi:hypothetical protein